MVQPTILLPKRRHRLATLKILPNPTSLEDKIKKMFALLIIFFKHSCGAAYSAAKQQQTTNNLNRVTLDETKLSLSQTLNIEEVHFHIMYFLLRQNYIHVYIHYIW